MAMNIGVTGETIMEGYAETGQKIYDEIREQIRTLRAKDMNRHTKTLSEEKRYWTP
jgi:hypothetical protein